VLESDGLEGAVLMAEITKNNYCFICFSKDFTEFLIKGIKYYRCICCWATYRKNNEKFIRMSS